MNKLRLTTCGGAVAVMLGLLGPSFTVKAAGTADSEQVSKLLTEAKTIAFQLKEDAVTMEGFTRMNVDRGFHVTAINRIREDLNAFGRQVAKLNEVRDAASPWQKAAIDRIEPYLDELGGYTTAVIEQINGDQRHTFTAYNDYLEANAAYATDLAAMLGDFVNFGNTREKAKRLGEKLEVK